MSERYRWEGNPLPMPKQQWYQDAPPIWNADDFGIRASYPPQVEGIFLLPDPAEDAERKELIRVIAEIIEELPPIEATIIRLHFRIGVPDDAPHTLKSIAGSFGVSSERVRQIESRALRRLRHPSYSRELRDFLI